MLFFRAKTTKIKKQLLYHLVTFMLHLFTIRKKYYSTGT